MDNENLPPKIKITQKEVDDIYEIEGEHNRGISDESKAPLEEVTTPKDKTVLTETEQDIDDKFYEEESIE